MQIVKKNEKERERERERMGGREGILAMKQGSMLSSGLGHIDSK